MYIEKFRTEREHGMSNGCYLYPKNTKDDEESSSNQDDVTNGFQGWYECLYDYLDTRGSTDNPVVHHEINVTI